MHRFFSSFLSIGVWLLQGTAAFNSGLSGQQLTTHYGLTECALLRITASYLRSVHNVTCLNRLANSTDLCDDILLMHEEIDRELRRLRIQSSLLSVVESICIANIRVNVEEFDAPASHFDNDKLNAGATLVTGRLAETKRILMDDSSSAMDARRSFGQAMHTLQDFYAHSNWVEQGLTLPNEKIGTSLPLGIYPGRNKKTCGNCTDRNCSQLNIVPDIKSRGLLISGYFSMDLRRTSKPEGKCSHGGPLDQTTQIEGIGYGINKDNEDSDHGSYHRAAARIALNATLEKLQWLWSSVGNEAFGRFLGFYSSDLVITIDTTCSMDAVIALVKEVAIGIVEAFRGENTKFRPSRYILSPFNDPSWGPVTVTPDAQVFIDQIQNLTLDDGGDPPELYFHGLDAALQVCEANSIVFTFTDESATDAHLFTQVLMQAKALNVRIFSFYVRSDTDGERHRRSVTGVVLDGSDRNVNGEILDGSDRNDIATVTGGFTIGFIPREGSTAILALITRRSVPQQSLVTIGGSEVLKTNFWIEATITLLHIDLISNGFPFSTMNSSLELVSPNGAAIAPVLVASSAFFRLYRIDDPSAGLWRLSSTQLNQHTIEITVPENATRDRAVVSCSTRLSEKIRRESIDAYAPLFTAPMINQSDLVVVIVCNNLPSSIQSTAIHFTDQLGATIATFNASDSNKTGATVIPVVVPTVDFRILTKVMLSDGSAIQRQSNTLITPTSIAVHVNNQPYLFSNGSITNVSFTVVNQAHEPLMILMCVQDTLQLLGLTGTCSNYSMDLMSTIDDMLEVYINLSEEQSNVTGGSMTFGINATSSGGKNLINYGKMTFYIQTQEYNDTVFDEDELVAPSRKVLYSFVFFSFQYNRPSGSDHCRAKINNNHDDDDKAFFDCSCHISLAFMGSYPIFRCASIFMNMTLLSIYFYFWFDVIAISDTSFFLFPLLSNESSARNRDVMPSFVQFGFPVWPILFRLKWCWHYQSHERFGNRVHFEKRLPILFPPIIICPFSWLALLCGGD